MKPNRFKFRAWQKDMDMMIYPKKHYAPKYSGGHMAEMYNTEECEFHIVYDDDDNFILMQSTGLLDKNGKEVFEGDILNIHANPYHGNYEVKNGEYILKDFTKHDRQKYHIGWHIKNNENTLSLLAVLRQPNIPYASTHSSEIIGNIYESPELRTTPTHCRNN